MMPQDLHPSNDGQRIVICDYNALLQSVTGLLRMSGYSVFQAHDGYAAQELCISLPDIKLLVVNTYGTGIEVGDLIRRIRAAKPGFPVLHIGTSIPGTLPLDVPTLAEVFTAARLLTTVEALIDPALMTVGADAALRYGLNAPARAYLKV
jgi:CheY-like chemotaxis protein